jgi:hypothetical protein
MVLFILAFVGGVFTILSPCILPVLPFVLTRADQPFRKSGLPLLGGMALTFAFVATLTVTGGHLAGPYKPIWPHPGSLTAQSRSSSVSLAYRLLHSPLDEIQEQEESTRLPSGDSSPSHATASGARTRRSQWRSSH